MLRNGSIPLIALLLAACPAKQDGQKETNKSVEKAAPEGLQSKPPGTADDEGETPTTQAHMQDHFSRPPRSRPH